MLGRRFGKSYFFLHQGLDFVGTSGKSLQKIAFVFHTQQAFQKE